MEASERRSHGEPQSPKDRTYLDGLVDDLSTRFKDSDQMIGSIAEEIIQATGENAIDVAARLMKQTDVTAGEIARETFGYNIEGVYRSFEVQMGTIARHILMEEVYRREPRLRDENMRRFEAWLKIPNPQKVQVQASSPRHRRH